MNNIITIMKKELKRFFGDRRMIFGLILPGILIFAIYSMMGTFMSDAFNTTKDEYSIMIFNSDYKFTLTDININNIKSDITLDEAKDKLIEEEIDLIIYFPENYNDDILNGKVPNVELYYYSKSTSSQMMYELVGSSLEAASVKEYLFTINLDNNVHDLTSQTDITTMILGMLVPFLLVTFLVTGCMSVATESFAGEKERGTIATLLVTPVKRSHIALGKILALSITALLSAGSSLLGLLLSLPKLMPTMSGSSAIDMSVYSPNIIIPIILVVLLCVVFYIVVISIISIYAKSVKEATSYTSPLMIINMVLGVLSMSGAVNNNFLSALPIFNSINCLSMIFNNTINYTFIILTLVFNGIYIALGIFVLTKMFENEKIIFNK